MKKTIVLVFIVIAVMLTSNGCKKPKDGATGPQGPAGTNGNANVIGSTLYTDSGSWRPISTWGFSTEFTLGAITQAVVDKGVVMVYEELGTGWMALPYTYGIVSRSFSFDVGTIKIRIINTDLSNATNPGAIGYRFVVITSSNRIAHPNVNYKNYEEVKKTFNLQD